MFVVTWLGAVAVWRFGRIEQRWALAPGGEAPQTEASTAA
jgi:high-affinity nickel-transport protein